MAITLKTLPQASLQDIFNQVAIHLLTQNQKSEMRTTGSGTVPDNYCLYRGPNGTCCAFGCLISDEEYNEEFEYKSVRTLYHENQQLPRLSNEKLDLVARLQTIHDDRPPSEWLQELTYLASIFPDATLSMQTVNDYLHHKNTPDSSGESERPAS